MESIVKTGALGDILSRCGIIDESHIRAALEEQKTSECRFGEALVKLGIVTQEDIDWALSNQLNIPYVRLKPAMIVREATALVSAPFARHHGLIPLICAGNELSIAIADPLNRNAIEAVEKETGCTVSICIGLLREIREMQELFYGPPEEAVTLGFLSPLLSAEELVVINHDLTGEKLVNSLLHLILQQKLSALSLQPVADTISVVCRQGVMPREIGRLSLSHYPAVVAQLKKLANMAEGDSTARGMFTFNGEEGTTRFHLALLRTDKGECITIRIHLETPFPLSISEMGVPQETASRFAELAAAGRGMVLLGSSDRQTRTRLLELYLQECDLHSKTVIVVGRGKGEGVSRFPRVLIPVDADAESVVMSVLEHDPDILVMEEVADQHWFAALCRAAIRGRLAVAGFDFGSAKTILTQFLSFRNTYPVASAHLQGVIVCQGVRTLCRECREADPAPEQRGGPASLEAGAGSFFHPVGCSACGHTGFRGKSYLMETISFDQTLRKQLDETGNGDQFLASLRESGWKGIAEEGKNLLAEGAISREDYTASITA
jgi:type II secretory ATPase GspE/PulE/Tfp pilus assembly ATPase PilB-like protein